MSKVTRYLYVHVGLGFLLIVLILNAIFMAFSMMTWSPGLLQSGWTLWQVFLHVLFQAPLFCSNTFPIMLSVGTLLGVTYLVHKNELIALQIAALSPFQIILRITPFIVFCSVWGFVLIAYVAPWFNLKSDQVRTHNQAVLQDVWFKAGQRYVFIQEGSGDYLTGVHWVVLGPAGVRSALYAERADYLQKKWVLQGVTTVHYRAGAPLSRRTVAQWPISVLPMPRVLDIEIGRSADQLMLPDLIKTIRYRAANTLQVGVYQMRFWQMFFLPCAALLLTVLLVPLVFREQRHFAFFRNMLLGVGISLVFYFFNQLFTPLAVIEQWPPLLAVILPTLLTLLIILAWWVYQNRNFY